MLTMPKSEIDKRRGKTPDPAPPAAPAAPAVPAPPAPATDNSAQLAAMQQAIATMANSMAQLPATLATLAPEKRPKKLEAIPERDKKGRISRIIVHVIE